jgi:hypothetical protein
LSVGGLLILLSVIVFVLAAAGVAVGGIALVPAGLALFAAGHLV